MKHSMLAVLLQALQKMPAVKTQRLLGSDLPHGNFRAEAELQQQARADRSNWAEAGREKHESGDRLRVHADTD